MATEADRLAKYRWQPGQSGNPKGRPRTRQMSERYKDALEFPLPETHRKKLGLPKNAKIGDGIAMALSLAALGGMVEAAREITDRVEGKAFQRSALEFPNGAPVQQQLVQVEFVDAARTPSPLPTIDVPTSSAPELPVPTDAPRGIAVEDVAPQDEAPFRCFFCDAEIDESDSGWLHVASGDTYCEPRSGTNFRRALYVSPIDKNDRCFECGEVIEQTIGRGPKRWVHQRSRDPYCNPHGANDMRRAQPKGQEQCA